VKVECEAVSPLIVVMIGICGSRLGALDGITSAPTPRADDVEGADPELRPVNHPDPSSGPETFQRRLQSCSFSLMILQDGALVPNSSGEYSHGCERPASIEFEARISVPSHPVTSSRLLAEMTDDEHQT